MVARHGTATAADVRAPSRDRIMEAARELFFEHGFSNVSTEAIAREAGVSKATLYRHFPKMPDLLQDVVVLEVSQFEVGIDASIDSPQAFQLAIVNFGTNLLRFLNQAHVIRFDQMMLEEARKHPEIASLFFHAAYQGTMDRLRELLQVGIDRRWLANDASAAEIAEQLLGMWKGVRYCRAQFGITEEPFAQPESWSEKCVTSLLRLSSL